MPPLLDAPKSFRHRLLLLLLLLLSRCRWCPKSLLEFQPALFLYFVVNSRAAFVVHWWWTCSRRICCLSVLFTRATTTTWPWRGLVAPAAATHSFNWSYSHLALSVRLPVLCRIINCDDSDSRCRCCGSNIAVGVFAVKIIIAQTLPYAYVCLSSDRNRSIGGCLLPAFIEW